LLMEACRPQICAKGKIRRRCDDTAGAQSILDDNTNNPSSNLTESTTDRARDGIGGFDRL
jgi:hypothetical protein